MTQTVQDRVLDVAKRLAKQALTHAAGIPGNPSGVPVREDAAVEYLLDRVEHEVEARDHLVPVLGKYLDLPVVNAGQRAVERLVVQAFIRRVWAEDQLRRVQSAK